MVPIRRQIINSDYIELERADNGQIWSITRNQVLAMLAAQNRTQVIAAIKSSLGEFLEVPSTEINTKLLLNALQTGELSLTLVHG